jgi:hypothetical protein
MLRGQVGEGDTVRFLYDEHEVRWEKRPGAAAAAAPPTDRKRRPAKEAGERAAKKEERPGHPKH